MATKFKYINESDRNVIRSARKVLKRLKKRFAKLDSKNDEALLDENVDWKPHGLALWRMCDELDWAGVKVEDDTNSLSITV